MSGTAPDDGVMQNLLRDGELHKTLLDQLDEAIYVVDCSRRILFWNHAAERITGFLAHEITGRLCINDLLVYSEMNDAGSPLAAVLKDGAPRECSALVHHKKGYQVPVSVQSRAICDASDAVIGAMEIFEETRPSDVVDRSELKAVGCIDELTDLVSRPFGEMKVAHALETYHKFGIPFGWLRIELDGMDDHQHRFGQGMVDAAIQMIARTLDCNASPMHLVTCWGRGEFRIQVYTGGRRKLVDLAEQLVALVRSSKVEWWGDFRSVTVSAGGSLPQAGDTLETLEARVAIAFDNSRASGGDRAAVANAEWRNRPATSHLGGK
jgi:PAS domain S-box-containing protein